VLVEIFTRDWGFSVSGLLVQVCVLITASGLLVLEMTDEGLAFLHIHMPSTHEGILIFNETNLKQCSDIIQVSLPQNYTVR
jgi:hypothetical protein